MTFQKYLRLKKLSNRVSGFFEFIEEVAKDTHWYGCPLWNKEHYLKFYNHVKEGLKYADLVKGT